APPTLLTLPQPLLGLLPVGDVPRQGHQELSAALPERFAPGLNWEHRPVLAAVPGLERDRLAGEELADPVLDHGGLEVDEVERSHPDQLVPGVPQALAGPAVYVQEAALFIAQEEGVGGVIYEHPEPPLAGPQRLLGLLLASHVQVQALDEAEGAVLREHPMAARPDPPDRAVLVSDAVLSLVHPPLPQGGEDGVAGRR